MKGGWWGLRKLENVGEFEDQSQCIVTKKKKGLRWKWMSSYRGKQGPHFVTENGASLPTGYLRDGAGGANTDV
jgi:hypothetical protein